MKNKNVMMGYLFIAPWIIYFLVFILYPFFLSFQNSFLDINVLSPESTQFVGLNNWISVSSDGLFWRSLFNVIFNQVIFVLLSFVLAMGMALLLHEITHFGGLFRTIMFIPVITSITVAMIIFNFLSSPAGPVQSLLLEWGVLDAPVFWKFERWLPMPLIAVFSTWKWFGIQMIIFLGGIAGISKSLYEAADIDGASWRRKTWSITLPLLKPQIIFVMTMNIINGMQMFIEVLMNFDLHGGPYNAALTPVLYLYKTGFSDMKMGTASTIGLLLAAVIYIFTMLQLKFTQEKEHS
ncbi:binding--dependent transport system inner membrane component family protein [Yersinia pseudotuberculosis IP 32953]|uniref:ABC sugar transporter, permease subunit n=6 Tax=Yersinia pseudotuberculosis complex TaxID=1649845 RepID=Q665R9_YERPS|nr:MULTISPECIES: sugar ABC transporter permease [Yersinia pseudotuberculosis complex]ABS49729.1 sugar ABC transporter, permease protein [Yersinia pseudotuberculosis IP 31758]AJJ55429.1 binding--dependent transport system inner membrane component family protein [Yersinia pseudotuberculosis IP 32953]AJJ57634.1 binding--dependent transport system inner membrane component family protein [Yersinia pseudotuberculosis YPIII]AJJ69886.1 binding--dependent transport system inner membrane component family